MTPYSCAGICAKIGSKKGGRLGGRRGTSPYAGGHRRCGSCLMYVRTDSVRCPCCNGPLRMKTTGRYRRQTIMRRKMRRAA